VNFILKQSQEKHKVFYLIRRIESMNHSAAMIPTVVAVVILNQEGEPAILENR
jgi:hypothetical protein